MNTLEPKTGMDVHNFLWAKSQESSSAHMTTSPVPFLLLMADFISINEPTLRRITLGHLLEMYILRPHTRPSEFEPGTGASGIWIYI